MPDNFDKDIYNFDADIGIQHKLSSCSSS